MGKNTKTTSFSLQLTTLERLNARLNHQGRSSTVDRDLNEYWHLLDIGLIKAKKSFTCEEALLILNVVFDLPVDKKVKIWSKGVLAQHIDAIIGLESDSNLSISDLVLKLHHTDDLTTWALIDWARSFWNIKEKETISKEMYVQGFLG